MAPQDKNYFSQRAKKKRVSDREDKDSTGEKDDNVIRMEDIDNNAVSQPDKPQDGNAVSSDIETDNTATDTEQYNT